MVEDFIKTGIIEPEALHELLADGAESVKIIDATFVLPGSEDNPHENYLRARIDDAVFFDIDVICSHDTELPHMLPSPEEFEKALRRSAFRMTIWLLYTDRPG